MSDFVSSVDVADILYGLKDQDARTLISELQTKIEKLSKEVTELSNYIKDLDPDANHKVVNSINNRSGDVTLDIETLGGVRTAHADTTTKYGAGSIDKYGHVKVTNTYNTQVNKKDDVGVAASGYGLQASYKELKDYINDNLGVTSFNGQTGDITFTAEDLGTVPTDHSAISRKYGGGTNDKYGHVMLTDDYVNISTSAERDGANASKGASGYALQKAYQELKQEIKEIGGQGVSSVNDKTGAVKITYNDVNAAPIKHNETTTIYGGGTDTHYGHVKVSDAYAGTAADSTRAENSIVPSLYAMQKVNQKLDNTTVNITALANRTTVLETKALTATDEYDVENPDKATSGADANIAASGYAVQQTYKETKANAKELSNLSKQVSTLQGIVDTGVHKTLTQEEYDALSYEEKTNGIIYFITDGFNGYLASDIDYIPIEGSSVQYDNVQDALNAIVQQLDDFSPYAKDIIFEAKPNSTIQSRNVQDAIGELESIIIENDPAGKLDIAQGPENTGKMLQVNSEGLLTLRTTEEIGLGSVVVANPAKEESETFLSLYNLRINGIGYEIESKGSSVQVSDTEPEDEDVVLWINTSKNYGE